MICPKCSFEQADQNDECSRCGVIFRKYLEFQSSASDGRGGASEREEDGGVEYSQLIRELLFEVKEDINPFYFGGRALAFLLVLIWGLKLIFTPMETNYTGQCFLHMANLAFHEAGHVLFRPFGELMTSLGGTLGQLLMPFICFIALLISTRDAFGASVALWWVAENFMDIAPYINDARDLKLTLLGGVTGDQTSYGFHDWEFILTELGWLRYDHALANISYRFGILLMAISLLWGGYLLFKQYQNLDLGNLRS